jgi:hypothetical protein
LGDEVSAPAKSATQAVSGLSAEFEALQKQLSAVEQMQANAFKFHDKNAYKASDPMAGVAGQQQSTLSAYASAAEAAAGREKAALAQVAEQQRQNLANYDAMAAKQAAQMAEIAKLQQKNLAGHDQDRDAAEGLRQQNEEIAKTSGWFTEINQKGSQFEEIIAGAKYQFVEAFNIMGPILAVLGAIVGKAMLFAITLTQQKEALRQTFDVFTGGMGDKLLADIETLASRLPYTADQLNVWAKSMITAVGSGKKLETAVLAVASAQAIMGEGGAAAAQALIKRFALAAETGEKVVLNRKILSQLEEAGVGMQALAKALGVAPEKLGKMTVGAKDLGDAMQKALIAQGAGPLAKLGNTWTSISAKIREGFEDAFEDLGSIVDPFMQEVKSFASEFFAGGIAAEDFKGVVKSALTAAFTVAREFVNFLHRGFLHIQIAALQVRIALKPVTNAIGEIGLGSAWVSVALYVLKGTVIVLAVAFGILALAVALVALPFILAGLAIYGVVSGIQYLIGLIGGAVSNFDNLKAAASKAGTDMIVGLATAIMNGHAWVVGLITNLATSMIGAIKTTLGIKSPSRVMMRIGEQTAEGMAIGVAAGTPDVAAAASGAGQAAAGGAAGGARAGGGGGGITVNVEAGAVVIQGASGDTTAMLEQALEALLERMLLQLGARRATA